jgi:aminomethyltransferase
MLMPLMFDSDREYVALTRDVAIWDVAAERQVQLKGPDAHKLAQLITCRDISELKVGKGVYAIMTDQDGYVINDPVLQKIDDETYWFSIADSDVRLWAKGVACAQGYDVEVTEPDVSPLALQGPKSTALVKELYGDEALIDALAHFDFVRDPVRTGIVNPTRPDLPPIPTLLARSGWSPELGYEIYLEDGTRGNELWDMCMALGKKHNIFPGAPNQQRRVEAGMLSFGGDTLDDTNALELGLPKRFVNPDMGPDFIGKEALQKIRANGVERTFCGFWFLDGALEASEYMRGKHLPIYGTIPGEDLALKEEFKDGHELPQIGVVTVIAWSPKFEKHIGLGYIDKRLEKSNAVVGVETSSGHVLAAKVSSLPFKVGKAAGGRTMSRKEV